MEGNQKRAVRTVRHEDPSPVKNIRRLGVGKYLELQTRGVLPQADRPDYLGVQTRERSCTRTDRPASPKIAGTSVSLPQLSVYLSDPGQSKFAEIIYRHQTLLPYSPVLPDRPNLPEAPRLFYYILWNSLRSLANISFFPILL